MIRVSPVLMLAGCPYLFEAPDLSHVGPDVLPGEPPEVVQFEVTPRKDAVVVHFSLADLDGDLVGGTVDLTDGSEHRLLAIPGDLDDWQPLGTSTTTLYLGNWLDCSTSVDQTWTLTATDLAGHPGAAATTSLKVTALGLLPEASVPNVWPTDAHTIGESPPFVGCVSWETADGSPDPVQAQLQHDVEGLMVGTPDTGDYVVQLWWATACDVDITVYAMPLVDDDDDGFYDTTTTSWNFGNVPEEATFSALAGDSWFTDFAFYQPLQGVDPPFQAQFLVTPK